MAKGKWIDKKKATHFNLVYRPQNDPLIHDESAPAMVLAPTVPANVSKSTKKGKGLSDLASELGSEAEAIRANEGEAASYGVYYDDTEYDYMQHLRDLGTGAGQAVFVEAKPPESSNKSKNKSKSLDQALAQLDLKNTSEDLLDKEILPSTNLQRLTYQAQQDVPDAIAGFQPDMDPRLREVLEALEDDAYVDDNAGGDDDDIFAELAKGGVEEVDAAEFEEEGYYDEDDNYYYEDDGKGAYDDEDDGWESDRTVKAADKEKPTTQTGDDDEVPQLVNTASNNNTTQDPSSSSAASGQLPPAPSDAWMEDFKKFQSDQKSSKKPSAARAAPSEIQSSIWTTTTSGGRRKKRQGALTNPSTYSMSSSSLVRTEQLSILDRRCEKIEEEFNADLDDDMQSVSAVSAVSTVQGNVRADFEGMMDEFLDQYSMFGKKRVKKGKWGNGTAQFDELRKELGPPLIPSKYRS